MSRRGLAFEVLAVPLGLVFFAGTTGCRNDGTATPDADAAGEADALDDGSGAPPDFPTFAYGNADNADPAWVGNYVGHREEGGAILLDADGGRSVKVVVCEPGLIRIVYAPRRASSPTRRMA